MGQRYRRMESQKPRPDLALGQDFAEERGPKSKVKKGKFLKW